MKSRNCIVAAMIAALPAVAHAHYGQRVWADINNSGQLMPVVGPPGNAAFSYSPSMFFYSRVYARDLGDQADVNYTTLLGGPLRSDNDLDDDGVNYESNFPGYTNVPYATRAFPAYATYNVSIAGSPLYFMPANGSNAAHFAPVSSVYAGQSLPYFTISNVVATSGGNEVFTMDSYGNGSPVPCFTTGSHGHPNLVLHPNPNDDEYIGSGDEITDSDQYDGIYALPMQLSGPSASISPIFYEVVGKNEPLSEIAAAGIVAQNTLVAPVTSQWTTTSSGSWGANANWSAAMPLYTGDTAVFGTNANSGSALIVTLDGNYSVGHLIFNSSASSCAITPGTGGFLSIGATNSADITVLAGSHTIAVPVSFAVSLNVNTTSGTRIILSNSVVFPPAASYPYSTTLTKTGGGTLTLSGSISTGFASTFTATGGTTVFGTDPTADLSIVASAADTKLLFTSATGDGFQFRNAASLNVSSGALVTLQSPVSPRNRTVLYLGSLSIDSASILDLGSNDLVIQNADSSSAAITLASVSNWLSRGYNNGRWNGIGGINSTAAASNSTHLTAIGSILNDNGIGSPIYSSFDGTASSNPDADVLLKYTYYGDADLDGHVDGSDYSKIDYGFLEHLTGWANGDFNYDGVIDGSDYTLIDNAFNTQGASLGDGITTAIVAAPTDQIASVPEPSALSLILLTGGLLFRRRPQKVSFASAGGEKEAVKE